MVSTPTFGTGGTALTTLVGGAGSAMALQSDGKIVMVGGRTLSAFVLARFDVDGALDDSFGEGGIVLTDIAGGFGSEQARAVAIQPDDQKIVVVGNTPGRIGADVCVLRYEPDGRLDETFATVRNLHGHWSRNRQGRSPSVRWSDPRRRFGAVRVLPRSTPVRRTTGPELWPRWPGDH